MKLAPRGGEVRAVAGESLEEGGGSGHSGALVANGLNPRRARLRPDSERDRATGEAPIRTAVPRGDRTRGGLDRRIVPGRPGRARRNARWMGLSSDRDFSWV